MVYDSKLKCLVETIDFVRFSENFIDDEGGLIKFGKNSIIHAYIETEKEDDHRDIEIKRALTNEYEFRLDYDDVPLFIDLVENKNCIKCDLTLECNETLLKFIQEIKENDKYTESYILDNIEDDYKFLRMSTLSKLPHNIFQDYPDKFDWGRISFLKLSMDFIDKNNDRIVWGNIDYEELSIPMFGKYYNKLSIPKVIHDMLPIEIKRELEINKVLDI